MVGDVSIIGAGGFIGGAFAQLLVGAGVAAYEFTRRNPVQRVCGPHPAVLRSEVIFHLASSITPAIAEHEPWRVAEDHATLTSLLDGLRGAAHRPLLVAVSSGGTVYDSATSPPYREDAPLRPRSAYGRAKLAQESMLAEHVDVVAPVILRLSNVYGPGQRTGGGYGVIGHWMEAARDGREIGIFGDPTARRDYVHVADVCAALLDVYRESGRLRNHPATTVFNVGSGVPTSLETLHQRLEETLGESLPVRYEPARTFDRRDVWLDIGNAERILGWRPSVGLADGLADTWQRQYAPVPATR